MGDRIVSALGACVILALAFAACPRDLRRSVRLRTLGVGLGLLVVTSFLLLRTPLTGLFSLANAGVERLLGFTREGARFVFGGLVTDQPTFGFLFAFQVLPTILFFSALMSVLYHLGVMPWLIERAGRLLSRAARVSGPESFSTVADVFVGQTEAPLVIRPYLARMTRSEIHACMVAGYATTAGGVLAAYVAMLGSRVPGLAGHLIACSVMSAPASLVVAKLMLPEAEAPSLAEGVEDSAPKLAPRETANLLEAVTRGTSDGVRLAVNVGAMLIVFLAFTALFDAVLGAAGGLFGLEWSLERLFGWLFAPLAFLLGVPGGEVLKIGALLGQKTAFNEFVAYSHMASMLEKDPAWLSERGRVLASYALCGFANFGSVGIQIAGYSSLAPERRADISSLALRAMLGGLFATSLVACVAGVFL